MTLKSFSLPLGLAFLFAAATCIAPTAPAQTTRPKADPPPVQNEAIREWIARYHPSVYTGDPRVNAVLIVVDTNSQYVASVADSLSPAIMAAIDSGFAAVAAHIDSHDAATELSAGRLMVPGGDGKRPVYIVDGERKPNVDSLKPDAIVSVRIVKPVDALAAYGPDASGGAIIVTTFRPESPAIAASRRERLLTLGIKPERVDDDQMQMRVRPGAIGPNQLHITVLRLKGGAF